MTPILLAYQIEPGKLGKMQVVCLRLGIRVQAVDPADFGQPIGALAGVLRGRLTREEAMAIRWHMGFSGEENKNSIGLALEMYPLALATHIADMESTF